jgi:DegV family protein with EDD domain
MAYNIVADSSCDLTPDLLTDNITLVPLSIFIDEEELVDDSTLEIKNLISKMKASHNTPRTNCPSPGAYYDAYKKEGPVFVITLSSKLSGSYNSAMTAKVMFEQDNPDRFVHVFDSKSASSAETLIYLKLLECESLNMTPEKVVTTVEVYIASMQTLFVLESLDVLIKNGRINKFSGLIATKLAIKPIMRADNDGNIKAVEKTRGLNKALSKLIDHVGINKKVQSFSDRILAVSHCNNLERGESIKALIESRYNFKQVIVIPTHGLSSTYANDGGIIVAY